MNEIKERLMSLLWSICRSETIMGGEYKLVHADHIQVLKDIIKNIGNLEEAKKVEIPKHIPKHIPNDVIQDLNRTVYPGDVKCIAHKVNEIINYLQYGEKKEEQED